ncbi:hypothetical protein TBLA_0H01900 [Henningerozyma blattae CBS 6284]|uniref:Abscisic acid G-protein coupled receptor-like domain-containing protein n=1 Tax=Henningerozyma blattae (strain ATCC 34711 / CBS 6284 / DSM 70876 / NBRC 10599 / NRRL Y-10934 / UCD 77-7) TaxID=1071380 RepID=I2H7X4_HENB6|nr:hypothetical protein TBLA_0H01900 [Tetrapisispora blattae CBS 6284]CCH62476.1 hypothetical protein TBLA_0H01900 [Tetrapisispora blattae CBS 6284]
MLEDLLLLILLAICTVLIYHWSYTIMWYRLGGLFETVTSNSKVKLFDSFPELETDTNSFFYNLYSEYSVSSHKVNKIIHVLFSIAMTCYVDTIVVILWQIMTVESEQEADFVSLWIWPLLSMLLSVLLILVQPFLIIISVMNKFFREKMDVDRLIIFTTGTLFVLIMTLNSLSFGPFQYTYNILTKISIAGVSILAILSGIATVSTLYYTFTFIWKRGTASKLGLSTINRRTNSNSLLWTTDVSVMEKIHDYELNIKNNIEILRTLRDDPGEGHSQLTKQLMEKIGWYQIELAKLESQLKQPSSIKTFKRIFQGSFTIYCLHKIIITFCKRIPHIIEHAWYYPQDYEYDHFYKDGLISTSSDPLAVTLANVLDFIFFKFQFQHELDYLTKQISLLLSTSLFICSLSTVATTISYLLALLPLKIQIIAMFAMQSNTSSSELPISKKDSDRDNRNNIGTSRDRRNPPSLIKNLLVSELAGIYVVATTLTIRSNLPFEISQKLNLLLGKRFTVPNLVIDNWFDEIYAITCLVTITFIKLAERTIFRTSH